VSNDYLLKSVKSINGIVIEIWNSGFQHALDGHPEVTLEKVEQALKKPYKVVQSKRSNISCLFYGFEIKDEKLGSIYFCVVVKVINSGKGVMETAYEANFIKTGKVLFSREEK